MPFEQYSPGGQDTPSSGSSGDAAADAIIRKKERAGAHKRRMPPIADPFTETWI